MTLTLPALPDTGVVRGACPHDCPDTCAMLVQVENGRAVAVRGDPDHPVTQGFLCAKVNRYPDRSYHPERLTTPLRRFGTKGEGRYEPASWDDALGDIAARLTAICEAHGPQAILPYSYSGTLGVVQGRGMDRRFFHRLGASLLARTICAAAGTEGWRHTYGDRVGPTPEEADRARLILLWGTNTLTSNPHLWPALQRARAQGARLIAVDPIRTRTAAQCDEHLAIRPGTDAALALAMINIIFQRGLQDAAYLRDFTDGWEALPARAAEWDLGRAAEVTGLAASAIERLATDYATASPTLIRLNYGMQRHAGGGMAVRVVSLLPAVTGAWREVGGGALLSTSGAFKLNDAAIERPDWVPPGTRTINMVRLGEALTEPDAGVGGPPVQCLFVYNSNPAAVAPELGKVREGLRRPDLFTVVLEHFHTDTADYADWILPATTQLEHWDLHTSYGHLYLTLNQPAIEPLGDCLPNSEIFRRLGRKMGFTDPEFGQSDTAIIQTALESGDPSLDGITFERLLRDGWARLAVPQPYAPLQAPRSLKTPSGKIQIRAPHLPALGADALPAYTAPRELSIDNGGDAAAGAGALTLLSPPEHHLLNSTFANLPSTRKRLGNTQLLMNPEDAASRGLAAEEVVDVENGRGSFRAHLVITADVRPGVVASYGVRWQRETGSDGTVNDTTSQQLTDLGDGAVFYDNAVWVRVCYAAGNAVRTA